MLRIPPSAVRAGMLFAGWGGAGDLPEIRVGRPQHAAARLMAGIRLRVNEVSHVYLADVNWDLGQFGTLHVRLGKGPRGSGPRERMVPLINCAGRPCGHQRPRHARPSQVVRTAVPRNSTARQNLPLLVLPVVVGASSCRSLTGRSAAR